MDETGHGFLECFLLIIGIDSPVVFHREAHDLRPASQQLPGIVSGEHWDSGGTLAVILRERFTICA